MEKEKNNSPSIRHVDVLIIGAGPVGLSLLLELGQRGIRCLLVDENKEGAKESRAKQTNVRSMEHFRRLGIAGTLRNAASLADESYYNIVFATRLIGYTLARFEHVWGHLPAPSDAPLDLYAEPGLHISQNIVEAVLRQHIQQHLESEMRFGWRLVSFEQDDQKVIAEICNVETGQAETIEAAYLAGCDGSHSTVRKHLGISMQGTSGQRRTLAVTFRAPTLWSLHNQGKAIQYWIVNESTSGILGPLNETDLWWFQTPLSFATDVASLDIASLLYRAVGKDFPCEVLGMQPWIAHQLIATHYRDRRIFLLGDAAHLHPPTGGYGMNMGIGDAVDLGWKLAAALQGWGGKNLLDTYELERRPVHVRVIEEAVHNSSLLPNHLALKGIEDETEDGAKSRNALGETIRRTKAREFQTLGIQLGYSYATSPIIIPDGTHPFVDEVTEYTPTASPGSRAPHTWLADGSSLYDHFGQGLTLLQLGPHRDSTTGFEAAAQCRGVPLCVLYIADPALYQLYEAQFVLIRPDQHVAWRASELPSHPDALLQHVCGTF